MMEGKQRKFLTVAPFQCAWRKDLKFRNAGRGCVAFDAFAHNDVTIVFREHAGSQHYHYRRDTSPHYTVIIGSHRNRKLKIEVCGNTVVDVEGSGLCSSSAFRSYWISIYDGFISVGKGRYPFQNLVFQWLDSNPICSVQYVGLSSWDKHVGYRNVNVLPLPQNHMLLWKQVESGASEEMVDVEDDPGHERMSWGMEKFLESWDLADMLFVVGVEEKLIPAHRIILHASGNFLSSSSEHAIKLRGVRYSVLHALLQYIYTGRTRISEPELCLLFALAARFEVVPLMKQCEEGLKRLEMNKRVFHLDNNVELSSPIIPHCCNGVPFGFQFDVQRLKFLYSIGEYSDVSIYVGGHGLVAHSHKVILCLWSVPFIKMFTNGMVETSLSDVYINEVPPEAFKVMLEFMYCGELHVADINDCPILLLQLLLLADQFGVGLLFQECSKLLLESLNEDSVCPILQVVSSIIPCKLIKETCEKIFATHFDYCTTASCDFILLDGSIFSSIIQHQDLTVTSEERILDAILMWCMGAKELCGWEVVDELLENLNADLLFKEKLDMLYDLLPHVRFPLLSHHLLNKLVHSNLSRAIHVFYELVKESIDHLEFGYMMTENGKCARFHHRRSSYKELQYITEGDSNGVLYFSGTSYGKHQWVNPVLAKRVNIAASSPTSRYTDPKALASRAYQGMSFAGPRVENGCKCSWWMVDIGQDHQLMCNYYTLRQDGTREYIRSWNFQGSLDGESWMVLRVHEDDQTMCKPAQFASWPITGPPALLPFRFFRVLLTGPVADSNEWNLCICFLELYGFFR